MLIRFKRKLVQQEAPKKPPVVVPSQDKNWKPEDVETPPAKRRLKAFEQKQEYVAIIEYREKARSGGPLIQKIEFKSEGGFSSAAQAAYRLARMIGKAISVDLHELRNEDLCRVIAVYSKNSFKNWELENKSESSRLKNKEHIDKAIKIARKDKINPISYVSVSDVKTR